MTPVKTQVIRVFGIVQGVGFRPFVSRIADAHRIKGSVCNKGPYVEIIVQGNVADTKAFRYDLEHRAPERSAILKINTEVRACPPYEAFDIIESAKERGDIFVSPDIAICDKCKEELFDKTNRRYLHPFINCTACGPRLTILDSMPYDRERTSMGEFPMCDQCHYEYTHAETRRYDAQPVCCNDCGPQVYIIGREERGPAAITYARQIISSGGIVAVKGIGGFHLCCDATDDVAVKRLRKLKARPVKPFAVMMKDLATAQRECEIYPHQQEVLDGHQKPIILLKRKTAGSLSPLVAPGNPKIGVMLPYAPLQLLLFTYDDDIHVPDCLIMTSANESGAPICRNDDDAVRELSRMCDAILSHDRKIRLRADDSVMDFYNEKPYMIRRSRGYAPLPFMLSREYTGQVLGIGGELKNTFCIGRNNLFYQSPYIGDMADVRTVKALKESIVRMETLLETTPTVVACDLHPRYNTTYVAEELGLPVVPVQHHYAHIVSCMAENDYDKPVIGISFDGTGYGSDGTIWGGEILIASYDDFTRLGSIKPFQQIGGDASAREGWRIAVSMLHALYGDTERLEEVVEKFQLCDAENLCAQLFLANRHLNSVTSTSAGRLFDAVSAILGICRASTFEGDASMALEFAAEAYEADQGIPDNPVFPAYGLTSMEKGMFQLKTDYLVRDIVEAKLAGADVRRLAYGFHQSLAEMIVAASEEVRRQTQLNTVALSGGVFQNHLLLKLCDGMLQKAGFTVLKHSLLPPNDGGIALGQAVVAMERIHK